jgi:hypothetical protein
MLCDPQMPTVVNPFKRIIERYRLLKRNRGAIA